MPAPDPDVELSRLRARLTELELERTALQFRLAALARPSRVSERASAPAAGTITDASTPEEKLALFRGLFAEARIVMDEHPQMLLAIAPEHVRRKQGDETFDAKGDGNNGV